MPGESLLAKYLSWLFRFALAAAAFLAVLQITIGGIQMIFGGASETARTNAKQRIQDAIWGLVLALGSVLILTTISTQFKDMKLTILDIKVTVEKTADAGPFECYYPMTGAIFGEDYGGGGNVYKTLEECVTACKNWIGWVQGWQCRSKSATGTGGSSSSGWKYDSGIEKQISDASPSLDSLLSCMREKLPPSVGRISSISDSKYTGNLAPCNSTTCTAASCKTTKSGVKCPTDCAHTCQSCHYGGGGSGGESQAVDFGDEENYDAITKAAVACGAGYVSKDTDPGHANHVHVSTKDCRKN
ncbi:MAG: hypothetical protein HY773_01595 [Candidatus Terrybacteria bacterium]|nr:hypothetical protein [Candidatus Terrybacteria bacterium]